MTMTKLLLLNGPNLNLLGTREPDLYGRCTLPEIEQSLQGKAQQAGHSLSCFQSNAEHALIDRIHRARDEQVAFILFNPGAYTHTSIALRDALLAVGIPFIELHLTNVHARESFRHHSYFSDIASGVIMGLGTQVYDLGLQAILAKLATAAP
jgi:3-dehydroquinate dehydratase-2